MTLNDQAHHCAEECPCWWRPLQPGEVHVRPESHGNHIVSGADPEFWCHQVLDLLDVMPPMREDPGSPHHVNLLTGDIIWELLTTLVQVALGEELPVRVAKTLHNTGCELWGYRQELWEFEAHWHQKGEG
jgi:hypothetical protein